MEKLIITAAICGAEVTKEQNPAVPYTVEEIVREAQSAVQAGAAIVHLHVREDDGTPTQSKARFKECMDAIYKVCPDVIIIPSTGGAVGMTAEERLQPTELFPEMATLDCGTCNFGDDVFENTMPMMRAFGKRMLENKMRSSKMGHIPIVFQDERLSTTEAEKILIEADVSRKNRKKVIDKQAAVIILQRYLDSI